MRAVDGAYFLPLPLHRGQVISPFPWHLGHFSAYTFSAAVSTPAPLHRVHVTVPWPLHRGQFAISLTSRKLLPRYCLCAVGCSCYFHKNPRRCDPGAVAAARYPLVRITRPPTSAANEG